jgi:uncharacterized protein YegL
MVLVVAASILVFTCVFCPQVQSYQPSSLLLHTRTAIDEAIQLASDIASSVTSTTPNADIALFVPYVFIESTMNVVGDKLMVGAEVRS